MVLWSLLVFWLRKTMKKVLLLNLYTNLSFNRFWTLLFKQVNFSSKFLFICCSWFDLFCGQFFFKAKISYHAYAFVIFIRNHSFYFRKIQQKYNNFLENITWRKWFGFFHLEYRYELINIRRWISFINIFLKTLNI